MNKSQWFVVLFLLLIGVMARSTGSYAAGEAGEVLAVKNSVYVVREGRRNHAQLQMPLLLKDAVATDEKSRAKLYFQDDSILNLGELSRVEVEEYLYSPGKERSKSIYRLMIGALKVVVGRSDLEIHTPTAVAAARGTTFWVIVEKIVTDGAPGTPQETDVSYVTHVLVLQGKVMVKNIDTGIAGAVMVEQGEMSSVPKMEPPKTVGPIDTVKMQTVAERAPVMSVLPDVRMPEPVQSFSRQSPVTVLQETKKVSLPPVQQQPEEGLTPVKIQINF